MIYLRPTRAAARALAAELRALHAATDYVVRVLPALFPGDAWRVSVGI